MSPTVAPGKRVHHNKTARTGVVAAVDGENAIVTWDGRQVERTRWVKAANLVVAPLGDAAPVPPDRKHQHVVVTRGIYASQRGIVLFVGPEFSQVKLQDLPEPVKLPTSSLYAEGARREETVAAAPNKVVVPLDGIAAWMEEYQARHAVQLNGPVIENFVAAVKRKAAEAHTALMGAVTRSTKRFTL